MTTRVRKMYVMLSSVDWEVLTWEDIRIVTSRRDRENLKKEFHTLELKSKNIFREFLRDLDVATGSICFPIDETGDLRAELCNKCLEFWNIT